MRFQIYGYYCTSQFCLRAASDVDPECCIRHRSFHSRTTKGTISDLALGQVAFDTSCKSAAP